MTADYAALIRAVAADPDDDLPRLVAADYLEENGQGPHAAFIRRQVENAANGFADSFLLDLMRVEYNSGRLPDRMKELAERYDELR